MFETSFVRERTSTPRYLLSASLAVHTFVIVAVLAASIGSISFPTHAPNEVPIFRSAAPVPLPPALGVHHAVPAPPHPAAAPRNVLPAAMTPPIPTVPSVFPATTVPASNASPDLSATSGGGDATASGNGEGEGDPNGVVDGQPGGAVTGDGAPTTYTPGGEVVSARVLQRVDPLYPQLALAGRISGVVVLRCIIDSSGQPRDITVVSSSFSAFEKPAVDALSRWKFRAGSLHGNPVDTWFELTIRFTPR